MLDDHAKERMSHRLALLVDRDQSGEQRVSGQIGHALEQFHQVGDGDGRQTGQSLEQRKIGAAAHELEGVTPSRRTARSRA
jgi:hypothetical protein